MFIQRFQVVAYFLFWHVINKAISVPSRMGEAVLTEMGYGTRCSFSGIGLREGEHILDIVLFPSSVEGHSIDTQKPRRFG